MGQLIDVRASLSVFPNGIECRGFSVICEVPEKTVSGSEWKQSQCTGTPGFQGCWKETVDQFE